MSQTTFNAAIAGKVGYNGSSSWSVTRGASGGNMGPYTDELACQTKYNGGSYDLIRGFMTFDTSSLPDNAVVSAVTLSLYSAGNGGNNNAGMKVVNNTQANNTYLISDDYDACDTTVLASVADASITGTVSISMPTASVNKTGYTKYCLRTANDNDNVAIGSGYEDFYWFTNAPQLTVTYTTPPSVTTGAASNIQGTTADLAGEVTGTGGGTVSERGVCWSTTSNPTTSDSKQTSAGSTGSYTVGATGLSTNTLYHYRAYVTTENSTQYGDDQNFTTDNTPSVSTTSLGSISPVSVIANGNVTDAGNNTVSERGFVIAKTENPTTGDTKVTSGSGTGTYNAKISGLHPGSRYHVRAYAINGVGTSYGADFVFVTPSPAVMFLVGA